MQWEYQILARSITKRSEILESFVCPGVWGPGARKPEDRTVSESGDRSSSGRTVADCVRGRS